MIIINHQFDYFLVDWVRVFGWPHIWLFLLLFFFWKHLKTFSSCSFLSGSFLLLLWHFLYYYIKRTKKVYLFFFFLSCFLALFFLLNGFDITMQPTNRKRSNHEQSNDPKKIKLTLKSLFAFFEDLLFIYMYFFVLQQALNIFICLYFHNLGQQRPPKQHNIMMMLVNGVFDLFLNTFFPDSFISNIKRIIISEVK